jgi:hypothetical protein
MRYRDYLNIKPISELVNEVSEIRIGHLVKDLETASFESRMRIFKGRVNDLWIIITRFMLINLDDAFRGILGIPSWANEKLNMLTKEFFDLAAMKLGDPKLDLFRYSSDSQESLEINPSSGYDRAKPQLISAWG